MDQRDVEAADDFGFPAPIGEHPFPLALGDAGAFVPRYLTVDPATFADYYDDDRQITAAVLRLHPLLGVEAEAAVDAELLTEAPRKYPAGSVLFELGDRAGRDVHLLLWGRAKLLEVRGKGTKDERRREIGQCRCGQLLGMPQLLRAYQAAVGSGETWPEGLTVEVVAIEELGTQRGDVATWVAVMKRLPDFQRFVENQVAVRFSRRKEVLQHFAQNALLRLLAPADAEYVLQLGALRAMPDVEGRHPTYLRAGAPGHRAALVLTGEATAYLPADEVSGERYVATFGAGRLLGHEALVMKGEEHEEEGQPVEIAEPARRTDLRLSPGAEILELSWYGFRWAMDDKKSVWDRVVRILAGDASGLVEPLPAVVNVGASRAGLGTTSLAYVTAVMLAWQSSSRVQLVDLQGAETFKKLGYPAERVEVELQSPSRRLRAKNRETRLAYERLGSLPPMYGIDVIWPVSPGQAETLIEWLKAQPGVRYIVVCGDMTPVLRDLGRRIDGSADTVLRVTDDASDAYDPGRQHEDPPNLTWVYRMNADYVRREVDRSRREPLRWQITTMAEGAPGLRVYLDPYLGRPIHGAPDSDTPLLARRAVRVPDAPEAALFRAGKLDQLLAMDPAASPLLRACARLVRVVRRNTVGLALGGGGAWGFAHVALIKNLEASGVPIDYISGTSFGSVVGGLYAGRGMAALDRLLDENSVKGAGVLATLRAALTGPLNVALPLAAFSGAVLSWFVDYQLAGAEALANPVCLGTTEIPFFPVGTNLDTHEELSGFPATVGYGVRMSGAMPPFFSTLSRGGESIADGALIANVPSRIVREAGAHFVIAANVVAAPTPLTRQPHPWLWRRIFDRVDHTLTGLFVLVWKAGMDQGALWADETLDFKPSDVSFLETWKGRHIVDDIRRDHFSGANERRLFDKWRDCAWRARWAGG